MLHFSAKTRAALARKGITIYGLQAGGRDYSETFYKVNDNGCGRVWSFARVLEAAR